VTTTHVVSLAAGLVSVAFMVELLRRRQLKEKYAVLWIMVGAGMLLLAVWPGLLDLTARALDIKSGPNLLLFVAALLLIVVCVHLSWEVSRLEDRSRALAEEIGLLRLELDHRTQDSAQR
jgi:hypothetical protein